MYSKAEASQIRKEFWIAFDVYSRKYLGAHRDWIKYNTGIKDFVLKFDVNKKNAKVMLSIEYKNEDKRFGVFVRLKEYELLFDSIIDDSWTWDEQHILDNGKMVCSLYKQIDNVNIYNKNHWSEMFEFMAVEMLKLEEAYEEIKLLIKDYIKSTY